VSGDPEETINIFLIAHFDNINIFDSKLLDMKSFIFSFLILICACQVKSQEPSSNQNPNYKASLAKYENQTADLTSKMNTTEQDTYKAYDWTEAKEAKRKDRIVRRQERALARINNRSCFMDYMLWNQPYFYYRY
jgi:hypothetical protein